MENALIKLIAMPDDVGKNGDLTAFVLKQLDLAAGVAVKELTGSRSVTIAMDKIAFKAPILVGDYVLVNAQITHLGTSSINIALEIHAKRLSAKGFVLKKSLVSANATFVSLDKDGKKIKITQKMREKFKKSKTPSPQKPKYA